MRVAPAPISAYFFAVVFLLVSGSSAAAQTPGQLLLVTSYNNDRVVRFDPVSGAFEGDFITPGGGGLDGPYGITYGPDGGLYVSGHNSDNVLRYDAQNGAFTRAFVPAGSGGLDGPTDIVFGPDGHLYVTDYNNDRILRYNGATGAFIGTFVAAGSGGLDGPNGFTFGPDGNLYVSSHNTDQVLRYNGTTGAFIDVFITAGSGGLDGPIGVVFHSGVLYVASYVNQAVRAYDASTGAHLSSPFSLNSPTGLLVDSGGLLYMASFADHNVRRHQIGVGSLSTLSGGLNAPVFMALTPTPPCTKAPVGMVSWWPGNQNGRDLMGNNYAALKNGATVAPAKVAKGFSLDGVNDFAEAPDNPSLDITGAISVDAWVKPDTTAGNHIILSKYDSPASQQSYAFGVDNGQVHFTVYQTGDASVYRGAQTTVSIPAGQFSHVAATFNPSTQAIKIYINGVEAPAAPLGGSANVASIFDSTAPLRIGAVKNSGTGLLAFDGIIDEVELFARELTADEVLAVWNAGGEGKCRECAPPPSGMLGWWPGDGSAHDIVGGHDGTLNNATFANGMVEQAFDFTGLPGVVVPDAPELNPQTFTIDAWVTRAPFSCGVCAAFVAAKSGSDGNRGFELDFRGDGSINFYLNGGTTGGHVPSTVLITDNGFHHLAATYDGQTMKLYIDGVLNNQKAVSTVINYEAGRPLIIGGREFSSTTTYPGLIDELELFDRALSAEEIKSIYNAGAAGKCRACAPPPTEMLSWWPAEGHTFDIQGTNHAALRNGATYVTGKVGQAFSLDGADDFVEVPNNAALNPTTITVDGWFYVRQTPSGEFYLVSKYENFAGWILRLGPDLVPAFSVHSLPSNHAAATSSVPVPLNAWVHLAGTYDGTTARIYVNGDETGSAALAGGYTPSNTPLRIGTATWFNGGFTNGLVDEVEIFSRALDASEIRAIADAGRTGKCRVDLSVTKLDSPDPVLAGGEITYTIAAKNLSDIVATNVTVTDQLPAGVSYVSDTGGCAHDAPNNRLTCAVGGLDPGQTFSFTVTVKTVSTVNAVNLVTVDGDEPDSFPSNNRRKAETRVVNLSRFTLSDDRTTGGCQTAQLITGRVTLSSAAPAGGATVLLLSSNPSAASVPASVIVPEGQKSATFDVTPGAVSSPAFVTFNAKLDSPQNPAFVLIQTLTVLPMRVRSLTLTPPTVASGEVSTGMATLSCAPAAQVTVSLSSSKLSVGQVPPTLVIDAGDPTGLFNVTTGAPGRATIGATLNGATRNAGLTVTP
ncbi:MAG TPA: LamG-like jellyroll fold domain-containing protein [Pyrinomonadaceae bacterium]|nr:LamG-like jellyroll fold domain-containing protein [Pyrinomonadaceae bacterium]